MLTDKLAALQALLDKEDLAGHKVIALEFDGGRKFIGLKSPGFRRAVPLDRVLDILGDQEAIMEEISEFFENWDQTYQRITEKK